jgi:hypothetical protein
MNTKPAELAGAPSRALEGVASATGDAIGLKLKCGSAIVEREQGWLVDQFIPDDTLIVVVGQVGLGKTTACLDWAASVSNGRVPIIGGKCDPRSVLMLSNEDSEAQLRRIFTRLGGDLSRLYVEDEDSDLPWSLSDVPALEAQIVKLRPALVIIDSLTTHKPGKVDLNSHGDVAPMLVALRKLASQHGCSIVVIHHTNKLQTSDPLAKISGSIGISATARHVILMAQHPEDSAFRVAAIAKTNLVKFGAPSYKFRLDPFAWGGTTELRASDILQSERPTGASSSAGDVFLLFQLANGPKPVAELEAMAETMKISRPTLYRAKKRLHIVGARIGFPATATWSLPRQLSQQSSLATETETTGELSRDNNNNQCLQGSGQLSQLSHLSQGQMADTTSETSEIEGVIW